MNPLWVIMYALAWYFMYFRPSVSTCHKNNQSTKNVNFIHSKAFLLCVVYLSSIKKASVVVSFFEFFTFSCHNRKFNNDLCTNMATSCRLCNFNHVMKLLHTNSKVFPYQSLSALILVRNVKCACVHKHDIFAEILNILI